MPIFQPDDDGGGGGKVFQPTPKVGVGEDVARSGASGLISGGVGLANAANDAPGLVQGVAQNVLGFFGDPQAAQHAHAAGDVMAAFNNTVGNVMPFATAPQQAAGGQVVNALLQGDPQAAWKAATQRGPTSQQVTQEIPYGDYTPQTGWGRTSKLAGAMAPALLMGPEGAGAKALTYAAGVGGGSAAREAALRLAPNHPGLASGAEFIGSMLGGRLGAMPAASGLNAGELRTGGALSSLTPDDQTAMVARALRSEGVRPPPTGPGPSIPSMSLPPLRGVDPAPSPSLGPMSLPPLRTATAPPEPGIPQTALPPLAQPGPAIDPAEAAMRQKLGLPPQPEPTPAPMSSALRYSRPPPVTPADPTSSPLIYSKPAAAEPPPVAPSSPLVYSKPPPEPPQQPSIPLTMAQAAPKGPAYDALQQVQAQGDYQRMQALRAQRRAIAMGEDVSGGPLPQPAAGGHGSFGDWLMMEGLGEVGGAVGGEKGKILGSILGLGVRGAKMLAGANRARTATQIANVMASNPETWDAAIPRLQAGYAAHSAAQRQALAQAIMGEQAGRQFAGP